MTGVTAEAATRAGNTDRATESWPGWSADDPAVRDLLDVLAGIIAEEFIRVARENPALFAENGGGDARRGESTER